ncbi:MAG: hypothetical protein AAGA76_08485 [Pseudomonadota bacterium]
MRNLTTKISYSALILAFATPAIQVSTTANAQSFSCANAQIPSEMAICNNENLLIKDEKLAELFADALVKAGGNDKIQSISAQHSIWLKKRNDCRVDFECLEKIYDERLNNLGSTNQSARF